MQSCCCGTPVRGALRRRSDSACVRARGSPGPNLTDAPGLKCRTSFPGCDGSRSARDTSSCSSSGNCEGSRSISDEIVAATAKDQYHGRLPVPWWNCARSGTLPAPQRKRPGPLHFDSGPWRQDGVFRQTHNPAFFCGLSKCSPDTSDEHWGTSACVVDQLRHRRNPAPRHPGRRLHRTRRRHHFSGRRFRGSIRYRV